MPEAAGQSGRPDWSPHGAGNGGAAEAPADDWLRAELDDEYPLPPMPAPRPRLAPQPQPEQGQSLQPAPVLPPAAPRFGEAAQPTSAPLESLLGQPSAHGGQPSAQVPAPSAPPSVLEAPSAPGSATPAPLPGRPRSVRRTGSRARRNSPAFPANLASTTSMTRSSSPSRMGHRALRRGQPPHLRTGGHRAEPLSGALPRRVGLGSRRPHANHVEDSRTVLGRRRSLVRRRPQLDERRRALPRRECARCPRG